MKKKKKWKKWIIIGIIVVIIIAIAAKVFGKKGNTVPSVQVNPLKKISLRNTIGTTGVVQSTDNVNVYTDLNYTIKTVGVKVGDSVKAGDVLCRLDTKELIDSIEQKKANLNLNSAMSAQKIKESEKIYNDNKSNLENDLNTQINSAQDNVNVAKRAVENAQQKRSDAKIHIQENLNTTLISAKANVANTKAVFDSAQRTYYDAKKRKKDDYYIDFNDEEIADKMRSYREAQSTAQENYDNAKKSLNAVTTLADEELEQYQTAVNTAQEGYDSAVKLLGATQNSANQELQNAQQNIENNKISSDDTVQRAELASLRTKLSKCTVTAPTSGTVTAVYAVKNDAANGVLFVIEDIGALKISVKIKEYDVGSLKEGMHVIVKSDSTGDDKYEGILQRISPTAEKSKDGKTVSDSNVRFDADIIVTSKKTRLKIGMNAHTDIIIEQRNSVFAVSYDAVTTDAKGKDIIYVAKKQDDATYKVEAFAVKTGIENDAQVEISGEGLKEGLQVISDSKKVALGEIVQLNGLNTDLDSDSQGKIAEVGAKHKEVMG